MPPLIKDTELNTDLKPLLLFSLNFLEPEPPRHQPPLHQPPQEEDKPRPPHLRQDVQLFTVNAAVFSGQALRVAHKEPAKRAMLTTHSVSSKTLYLQQLFQTSSLVFTKVCSFKIEAESV